MALPIALPIASRYSRSLKGDCERELTYGIYPTLEQCQAAPSIALDSQFDRYVAIEAMTFDPLRFVELAPSDKRQYLWQRYGIRVPAPLGTGAGTSLTDLGIALLFDNYLHLYHKYTVIVDDYLTGVLEEFDFLLMDVYLEAVKVILDSSFVSLPTFRLYAHLAAKQARSQGELGEVEILAIFRETLRKLGKSGSAVNKVKLLEVIQPNLEYIQHHWN